MEKCPRVLIVNAQSMYKKNATGITLQSIWSGWDADCLFEVYSDPVVMDQCNQRIKSYCIPPSHIIQFSRGKVAQSINSNIKAASTQQSSNNKIKSYLRQFAVCTLDSISVKLDKSTIDAIRDFHPQVIYTLGASVSIMRLVNQLSMQLNIPVIMHFMDNWAEHIQWEDNPLLSLYKSSLKKKMLACIKRCKLVVTISSSMAEAYHEKFQKETLVLMNTVDLSKFKGPASKPTGITHFVYAGGLHLDRWKALKEIAEAIKETDGKGILDIFTSKDSILNNLLQNILTHSDASKVFLTVTETEQQAKIVVADNGNGIAASDLPHIFERMYQCDHSRSAKGNGLGLSIAKELVSIHKGTITAASVPGNRTTFIIILPKAL